MSADFTARLNAGLVIPAHPLALDSTGRLDLKAQQALTRYYLAAGAHGLAVGVHTTQFELHNDPALLTEVWSLAAQIAQSHPDEPLLIADADLESYERSLRFDTGVVTRDLIWRTPSGKRARVTASMSAPVSISAP